jgi:hypothetical protein
MINVVQNLSNFLLQTTALLSSENIMCSVKVFVVGGRTFMDIMHRRALGLTLEELHFLFVLCLRKNSDCYR